MMPGMNPVHPAMMNMNPMLGGHPVPPIGFDQYGLGMGPVGMPDPGIGHRFPHIPFQQPMPQQPMLGQMIQGYPGPGGPGAPRLQHHHSAPSGGPLPGPHTQMLIEQDVGPSNRPGSGILPNPHMPQYGAPIPQTLMRRSISPVPIQPGSNGLPNLPSSGKTTSRANMNIPGPSSQSGKEQKRIASGARPMEVDGLEREKERDRYQDGLKSREKDARDFHVDRDRELIYERERDRARERDRERESDRELDRTGHGSLPVQRISSHQHPLHLHPSSSQAGHHHPPHHHHHHHHVHHHHHPNASNGPVSAAAAGQTSTVTALHPSNGLASRNVSPHPSRELDRRAHSGAPVEVIDLSSAKSATGPMSAWKNNDDLGPPGEMHERAKLTGPAPRDRAMPPSYPSSPRNGPGPSTAPASMAQSRRGSWSAPDDSALPRPSSSASSHLVSASSSGPQRLPPAVNSTPRTQVSPSLPSQRSPSMISPSRHNSMHLPPLSPSVGSMPRSPLRPSQALPSTLPPVPTSAKSTSPKILRRTPPLLNRPKSPGLVRNMHGPPLSSSKVPPTSPPANIFSLSHSHSSLSGPRLPNISAGSEPSLPPPPKVNPLPVD